MLRKKSKKNLIFNFKSDEETVDKLSEELGDVLLCISMIASYYQIDLDVIVEASLDKMQKRFSQKEE
ncbi:MAG: MazG nucleotide pyrophosphohydrolase domain-containing protein [Cyanobacteriota bacterium]|nr:MazG nucleotide pyrophosphohydrolase domain-containing protein [Cyanobacteriota bacterium]